MEGSVFGPALLLSASCDQSGGGIDDPQHAVDALPEPSHDLRWRYPTPLTTDLQVRHLFLLAMDALDVAIAGLRTRTSAVAVGAIRYLAETFTLVCWLTDREVDDLERRKRVYRLALSDIVGTKRMMKHAGATASAATVADLKVAAETLHRIASDDGIVPLNDRRPDNVWLFKKDTPPGYVLFSALSEIGSHPGFLQVLVFQQDRSTRNITVNYAGQPGERAAWMSGAIDLCGRTCDEVATWFGFKKWIASALGPVVHEVAPLMKEAKSRWESTWGIERRDDVEGLQDSVEDSGTDVSG